MFNRFETCILRPGSFALAVYFGLAAAALIEVLSPVDVRRPDPSIAALEDRVIATGSIDIGLRPTLDGQDRSGLPAYDL